jgi:hypothetical protein
MDIVVQPPRSARVGQALSGSIVVRVRMTNTDPEDDPPNQYLFAVASLIPGPNSTTPTNPDMLTTLLAGRIFDSIQPFADDEADGSIASMDIADPHGVGYLRFSDLAIRQAGTYRIRITLMRVPYTASTPAPSSDDNRSVFVVDSNPIVVNGNGPVAYNGKYIIACY